jgi:Tfp pilus assembly protein PilX
MKSLRNQRGVALPLVLIVLVLLTGFLIVFLSLGSTESLIGRSLNEVTMARYVAEAGMEWAYDVLVTPSIVAQSCTFASWNAALLGCDGNQNTADDGQLAVSMSLAGLSAAFGTFSVTVRNDSQTGDGQITGVAVDTGGDFNDTNNRVIVTAVGTVGTATRTIRAVLRFDFPPVVAALALPGVYAETTFNGSSFTVNGNDTNLDGTAGSGNAALGLPAAVWGIALAAGATANETDVQESLTGPQEPQVLGKKQDPSLPEAYGDNTIAPEPTLTSAAVTDFVNKVKARADVSLKSTLASHPDYTGIGSTCADNWSSTTCWGTQAKPKIVYIKGDVDPTSDFTAVEVKGTSSGAGILIIEDGDIKMKQNFRWDGIIIATGRYVGVKFEPGGGDQQLVYGAVISNATASGAGWNEAIVSGNAIFDYSSQGIAVARGARRAFTLTSWQEM